MIAKSNLIDGAYYAGVSKHAKIARWSEVGSRFYYQRFKNGYYSIESIRHIEDEKQFDAFTPQNKIEQTVLEIPLDGSVKV